MSLRPTLVLYKIAGLPSFTVGGTVHIVVNNQLGFTTVPTNNRSSLYSSDFLKTIGAPILVVNAEDVQVRLVFVCC